MTRWPDGSSIKLTLRLELGISLASADITTLEELCEAREFADLETVVAFLVDCWSLTGQPARFLASYLAAHYRTLSRWERHLAQPIRLGDQEPMLRTLCRELSVVDPVQVLTLVENNRIIRGGGGNQPECLEEMVGAVLAMIAEGQLEIDEGSFLAWVESHAGE